MAVPKGGLEWVQREPLHLNHVENMMPNLKKIFQWEVRASAQVPDWQVVRRSIRDSGIFRGNAAEKLGL